MQPILFKVTVDTVQSANPSSFFHTEEQIQFSLIKLRVTTLRTALSRISKFESNKTGFISIILRDFRVHVHHFMFMTTPDVFAVCPDGPQHDHTRFHAISTIFALRYGAAVSTFLWAPSSHWHASVVDPCSKLPHTLDWMTTPKDEQ